MKRSSLARRSTQESRRVGSLIFFFITMVDRNLLGQSQSPSNFRGTGGMIPWEIFEKMKPNFNPAHLYNLMVKAEWLHFLRREFDLLCAHTRIGQQIPASLTKPKTSTRPVTNSQRKHLPSLLNSRKSLDL